MAANYAYEYTRTHHDASGLAFSLTTKKPLPDVILVQGNQSSALGKLTAGCKFQTYYPITPASDDSEFLEANEIVPQGEGKDGSILVLQTEDEIVCHNHGNRRSAYGCTFCNCNVRSRILSDD